MILIDLFRRNYILLVCFWAVTVFSGRDLLKVCENLLDFLAFTIYYLNTVPEVYLQKTTAKKSLVPIYSKSWSRLMS